jgi:hypothetical protein
MKFVRKIDKKKYSLDSTTGAGSTQSTRKEKKKKRKEKEKKRKKSRHLALM